MRLTVFGSTGGTGEQIVRQALDAGHDVTAVARRPEAVALSHSRLAVVQGDLADPDWDGAPVKGADVVLSALGSRTMGQPTTVYSAGTAAILTAMRASGVSRFVGVTAAPAAPESQKSFLDRHVTHPLLHRFFGGGYDDMRRMEELLAASDVDWTVFRPPRLTSKPPKGRYRTAVGGPVPRGWNLTRADLAAAMLAAVDDPALSRTAVTIAN
jgi:putative NADH-flavin reductase